MFSKFYTKAKLLLLTFLAIAGSIPLLNAQVNVTIGSGTTVAEGITGNPLHAYYKNLRYQTVYTAAELSAAGLVQGASINSMGFSVSQDYGGGSYLGYTIGMAHTTATNSASNNTATLTTVKNPFSYDPTVTVAGAFDMITLDVPFIWDGTSNLLINICTGGNPYTSPYGGVRVITQTSGARFYRADGTASVCGTATNTTAATKPQIRFNYSLPGVTCYPASNLKVETLTNTTASISWSAPTVANTPIGYNFELRTSGAAGSGATGLVSSGSTTSTTNGFAALTPATAYTFYVMTDCGSGNLAPIWSNLSFTTPSYVPVALSGFGADVISNGIGTAVSSSTNAIDDISTTIGYALVAEDFRATIGAAAPTKFLPNSRSIYNGIKYYKLQDYSGANSMRLVGPSQTGTLTFLAPQKASNVYVMGVSGSAASTVNITVNFADGGTTVVASAQSYPDWYSAGTYVIQAVGRVNRADNGIGADANGPNLYEVSIPITLANQGRLISSITVATTAASSASAKLNILGVSILPSTVQGCALPINPVASNIGTSSADITWTTNGTSSNYQVSYGAQGTLASSGTIVNATGTTTYTIGSLTSATNYQAFVRAICGSNVGDTSDWVGPVNFSTTLLPCTGTITAGSVSGSNGTYANVTTTLTVTGNTSPSSAAGITYQWQSSSTGLAGSWTNIPGTSTTTAVTPASSTYYRYYTVCSYTNQSDTTAAKYVPVYCKPVYSSDCATHRFSNVTIGTINNTMTGCTVTDFTNLSTTLNAGIVTNISLTSIGYVGIGLAADLNNDGDFSDPGEILISGQYIDASPAAYNLTFTIPASTPAGTYRLRAFNTGANSGGAGDPCGATYAYGTFNDYTINVNAAVYCTGTPAPGNTVAATSAFCATGSTTLSLDNSYSTVAGMQYQWQQYDNGTSSWTDITSATSFTYTTPTLTQTKQYRCHVTCTATSSDAYSNPKNIVINPLPNVSASPVNNVFCGAATIDAIGANTFTWSPATGLNTTTGSSVIATPTTAVTYTVTGTDGNGCVNTATASVTPIGLVSPTATAPNSCAPNLPVSIAVSAITTPTGSIEYKLTDTLGTVIADWQSNPSFTVTPTVNGKYTYYVFARNTTCPSNLSDTGMVSFYAGFSGNVSSNNATCANGDGSLVVLNAQGPGSGIAAYTWYSNDFSSSTFNTIYAELKGVASVTSGYLQLTPNTTSQNGGFLIKNPNNISGHLDSVKFALSVPTSGADGISWSFGNNLVYYSSGDSSNLEAGVGNKLIISFDSYGTSGNGTNGIYLTYGQTNAYNGLLTTVTPTMLAYSNNLSWRAATNKQILVSISSSDKLTLTVGGVVIFNAVQLPVAYTNADKSTWQHMIAARTGGVSEQHYIDNLGIYYTGNGYSYGAAPANSNTVPSTWQTSNTFSGLSGGDSLDIWIANPSNTASCHQKLGTFGVSSPMMTSLLASDNPTCIGAEDGYAMLKVPTAGTYSVSYNKNGGGTITQTALTSGNDGTNEYVVPLLGQGAYTNIKVINATSCVSNNVAGPLTLVAPTVDSVATTSATSAPTTQPGAGTQYYTNNNCALIAAITSPNNLGQVTAALTVNSTAGTSTSGEPFLGRSYAITPSQNATLAANLKLYFTAADFAAYNASASVGTTSYPAILANGSNLRIRAFHGLPGAGTTGPNGTYDATNSDILQPSSIVWNATGGFWVVDVYSPNGFSGFFANTSINTPLNITLGTLSAHNEGAVNVVNWDTKTEAASDKFIIERSSDGRAFSSIGTQLAKGNAPSEYTFVDNKPFSGINYYRLVLMNEEGTKEYTKVVSAEVKNGNRFQFNVFPNPATSEVTVSLSDVIGQGFVELTDLTGRTIISKNVSGNQSITLSLNGLSNGMYIVKFHDDAHLESIKISKGR